MKKILMAIDPISVANILNGKKKIEFRKSIPDFDSESEYEVYIYCSQTEDPNLILWKTKEFNHSNYIAINCKNLEILKAFSLNDFILGSFTLKKTYDAMSYLRIIYDHSFLLDQSCMTQKELKEYSNGQQLYAWQIDNLKIFDNLYSLENLNLKTPPLDWYYIKEES